jgi:hypothetical protein
LSDLSKTSTLDVFSNTGNSSADPLVEIAGGALQRMLRLCAELLLAAALHRAAPISIGTKPPANRRPVQCSTSLYPDSADCTAAARQCAITLRRSAVQLLSTAWVRCKQGTRCVGGRQWRGQVSMLSLASWISSAPPASSRFAHPSPAHRVTAPLCVTCSIGPPSKALGTDFIIRVVVVRLEGFPCRGTGRQCRAVTLHKGVVSFRRGTACSKQLHVHLRRQADES